MDASDQLACCLAKLVATSSGWARELAAHELRTLLNDHKCAFRAALVRSGNGARAVCAPTAHFGDAPFPAAFKRFPPFRAKPVFAQHVEEKAARGARRTRKHQLCSGHGARVLQRECVSAGALASASRGFCEPRCWSCVFTHPLPPPTSHRSQQGQSDHVRRNDHQCERNHKRAVRQHVQSTGRARSGHLAPAKRCSHRRRATRRHEGDEEVLQDRFGGAPRHHQGHRPGETSRASHATQLSAGAPRFTR
jgi:hypothetical protein